jgi:MazG family protein
MAEPHDSSDPTPPGILDRALTLVTFLRENCPWDAAQTPRTLIPHILEETHEVVDAIRAEDTEALEGELGDLLLNLAFQIVVGEEDGAFTRESVTARLEDKMRRRHPHLFGLGDREGWEAIKARERGGGARVLDGLATGLDPLLRAHRIQERASGVGFDWSDTGGAWDKVAEELEEVRVALEDRDREAVEEELGDLLFAVVNLTRLAGTHPDTVLDRANRKFHERFEALEDLAKERGISVQDADLEVLDGLWEELKRKGP